MGYLCIVALIFAGELGIKNYVEKKQNAGEEKEICKGRILLRKYHNKGACMNLGEKKSNVVAGLSLILTAALALVFLFTLTRHGNGWLKAGLSLLLGGAFSNTYDRLHFLRSTILPIRKAMIPTPMAVWTQNRRLSISPGISPFRAVSKTGVNQGS